MNMVASGPATPQVKSITVSPLSGPLRLFSVSTLVADCSGIGSVTLCIEAVKPSP
jgi:hypothetical protein